MTTGRTACCLRRMNAHVTRSLQAVCLKDFMSLPATGALVGQTTDGLCTVQLLLHLVC